MDHTLWTSESSFFYYVFHSRLSKQEISIKPFSRVANVSVLRLYTTVKVARGPEPADLPAVSEFSSHSFHVRLTPSYSNRSFYARLSFP